MWKNVSRKAAKPQTISLNRKLDVFAALRDFSFSKGALKQKSQPDEAGFSLREKKRYPCAKS